MKMKSAPELERASDQTEREMRRDESESERERGGVPDTREQSEPPAVPAHDLQHEGARVGDGGRVDVVDGLADAVERGGRADGHVRQRHVVVDGPDQADDLEMPVSLDLLVRDAACGRRRREGAGEQKRARLGRKQRGGPSARSFSTSVGHSDLKTSAPVRDPSPPHTTRASIPSMIKLCAAVRRPSGVLKATDRAVPIKVPPLAELAYLDSIELSAHLRKPASDVVPADADDVSALERAPAGMIARAVAQELAVAKAEVLNKIGVMDFDGLRRGQVRGARRLRLRVSSDEAFVSFADDPSLAPPFEGRATSARSTGRRGK